VLESSAMDTRKAGKLGGKRRAEIMTPEQRSEGAGLASRAYWDSMTPEQRSAEMKKRAKKTKK
jgi:hypothetical protein